MFLQENLNRDDESDIVKNRMQSILQLVTSLAQSAGVSGAMDADMASQQQLSDVLAARAAGFCTGWHRPDYAKEYSVLRWSYADCNSGRKCGYGHHEETCGCGR